MRHTGIAVLTRALIATAALVGVGALLTEASPADAPARASASATLVDGTLGTFGTLRSGDDGRRSASPSVDERGVKVASADLVTHASRAGGQGRAQATAAGRSVDLLDGLVTAYGVRRTTLARDGRRTHEGFVRGLAIDGRMIGDVDQEHFYDVGDVGSLAVNRGATALKLTLTRPAHGFPAGTTVKVARVMATASDGADPAATPTATPTPSPTATPKPGSNGKHKGKAKPAERRKPPKAERRRAPQVADRLTAKRFAFPVYGKATIGGPFGAFRADTGAHQGNDVFAPFGAPVLAVTDGVLFKVGTRIVPGNRLWLRSKAGDEFFYAHLSAFAPIAENGREVKSGDVLGFTGNTGDAEKTPPHVHFEIHPGGGPAIDPHPFLVAWRDRKDVPPGAWLARHGADTEQRPGALVEVRDFIAGE